MFASVLTMAVPKLVEASWCLSHPVKRIKIYGGIGDYKSKANKWNQFQGWRLALELFISGSWQQSDEFAVVLQFSLELNTYHLLSLIKRHVENKEDTMKMRRWTPCVLIFIFIFILNGLDWANIMYQIGLWTLSPLVKLKLALQWLNIWSTKKKVITDFFLKNPINGFKLI